MASKRVAALMRRLYANQINGTIEFRNLIAANLRPEHYVLDLGCGRGREETDFRSKCVFVVGCDSSDSVARNQFISFGLRGDAYRLPFGDETFNVVIMDFVLEHLEYPEHCAREVYRVLKPGGWLFFRTPNFHHYVAVIASLTPQWAHRFVVRKLAGTEKEDAFETYYRVNTRKAVQCVFGRAHFQPVEIRMVEKEPYYLTFATPAFFLGYCYERLVNRFDSLAGFRSNIFGSLTRSSCAS